MSAEISFTDEPSKHMGKVSIINGLFVVNHKYVENGLTVIVTQVFDNHDDAENYRINRSRELGLVKNIYIDMGEYYIMVLTQNQCTLIDKNMREKVDKYHWYASVKSGKYIANTVHNGVEMHLHNYIMNFKAGESCSRNDCIHIGHKNKNSLDNRLDNLGVYQRYPRGPLKPYTGKLKPAISP